MEDYMKFDLYEDSEDSDISLETVNSLNKNSLNVDLLIDISPSDKSVKRKPLNLCFALDRSASMRENNRMEKLKDAMKEILSFLSPEDYFSIITYDDIAQVVLSSRRYNRDNDSIFKEIIDRISIGGGTNMLAGMLRGYDEINRNHNRFYRNRLILMSDGVSTTGEQNPDRILKHTIDHYNRGIETSTIGIGNNINFDLLHNISVEGRGKSHFIGDCDSAYIDIEDVLREEFYNMNAHMEDILLEISYPRHFKIIDVYGASKFMDGDKLTILCSNLSWKNQFIVVKFQSKRKNRKGHITVNMDFMENGENRNITKQISCINCISSEKMLLANKVIDAVNCARNSLSLANQRYKFDCLDRFVNNYKLKIEN
jgi:Mg-chelatase subunit ChlD